jgi:long-chain acyl-CoA synthetase
MTPTTAPALFFERVASLADRQALMQFDGPRAGERLSWAEWGHSSRSFAAAAIVAGHRAGEIGAILAGNRTLWPVSELGLLSAGMISLGIYPTSAPSQIRQLLADSGATLLVVDTAERLDHVLSVRNELPALRTIIVQDDVRPLHSAVKRWDAWLAEGAAALGADGYALEIARRVGAIAPDDTAGLIYTSGSTGEPKGACISHRYLLASAESIRDTLALTGADTTVSYLPFCHAAERVFGLHTRILCGMSSVLVEDYQQVWSAARALGPTLFGGLPHFYEKAFALLQSERERAPAAERQRWEEVLALGRQRSALRRNGQVVPTALDDAWRSRGEPLFARVRDQFGGHLRLATSGGAALPAEVAEFLDALGVTVLGAYGMTEHLCVAFHRPNAYSFDGVGPTMPGTELRLADDGEVLVRRGALTFSGYFQRPEETRAAFSDDGEWLLSGDLGSLDERGMLRITGRKKELIALSTGKKIAPLPVEARLVEDPWIAQAMLYGEGRKFVSALIAPRRSALESWAAAEGVSESPAELMRRPEVLARFHAAVDRVNAALSRTEQIRRFVLLDHELSQADDELTPNLKIRRGVVADRYRDRFDALYG